MNKPNFVVKTFHSRPEAESHISLQTAIELDVIHNCNNGYKVKLHGLNGNPADKVAYTIPDQDTAVNGDYIQKIVVENMNGATSDVYSYKGRVELNTEPGILAMSCMPQKNYKKLLDGIERMNVMTGFSVQSWLFKMFCKEPVREILQNIPPALYEAIKNASPTAEGQHELGDVFSLIHTGLYASMMDGDLVVVIRLAEQWSYAILSFKDGRVRKGDAEIISTAGTPAMKAEADATHSFNPVLSEFALEFFERFHDSKVSLCVTLSKDINKPFEVVQEITEEFTKPLHSNQLVVDLDTTVDYCRSTRVTKNIRDCFRLYPIFQVDVCGIPELLLQDVIVPALKRLHEHDLFSLMVSHLNSFAISNDDGVYVEHIEKSITVVILVVGDEWEFYGEHIVDADTPNQCRVRSNDRLQRLVEFPETKPWMLGICMSME